MNTRVLGRKLSARDSGFTLLELVVVVTVIGLIAAIAVPRVVRARDIARQNFCFYNLRLISGAEQMFSSDSDVRPETVPTFDDLQPYLGVNGTNRIPVCPADTNETFATSYYLRNLNSPPLCRVLPLEHVLH